MHKGLVNEVVVGADRIVKDAVVNKIGTFTVAVLAKEHGVPFYVAAPKSTFDLTHTSADVIIEERKPIRGYACGFSANRRERRGRSQSSFRYYAVELRVGDNLRKRYLLQKGLWQIQSQALSIKGAIVAHADFL